MDGMKNMDSLPQWKKELILRRRTQTKCLAVGAHWKVQLSCPSTMLLMSGPPIGGCRTAEPGSGTRSTADDGHPAVSSRVELVTNASRASIGQCSRLVDNMVQNMSALPGSKRSDSGVDDHYKNECDSDSSEELKYGPGIVNKLKSKYLSLTLRDCTIKSRPSILRRATSLEHLLDDGSDEKPSNGETRRYIPAYSNGVNGKVPGRYRSAHRNNKVEAIKRTRSVETLVRYNNYEPGTNSNSSRESINEDVVIVKKENADKHVRELSDYKSETIKSISPNKTSQRINRPKRIAPLMDETERPPAEIVKTKLLIFESVCNRKLRSTKLLGDVAVKVDKFKTIIDNDKPKKPIIKPKPILDKNKKGLPPRHFHPIDHSSGSDRSLSPKPCVNPPEEPVKCSIETPKPSDELTVRPDISKISEIFERTTSLSESETALSRASPVLSPTPPTQKLHHQDIVADVTAEQNGFDSKEVLSQVTSPVPEVRSSPRIQSPRPETPETCDENDGTRTISKSAITNISNASQIMHFQFDTCPKTKTHLPGMTEPNLVPKRELPPLPPVPPRTILPQTKEPTKPLTNGTEKPKTFPIETPLESFRIITQIQKSDPKSDSSSALTINAKKPMPVLTNREIEKNLINRVKTLEQPVSKVVVSVKSADEICSVSSSNSSGVPSDESSVKKIGNGGSSWEQKPWHQQPTNTMVFNFSNRKDVPDYIENDGMIHRRKREKPKPGEGGIILLADAPVDESFTDDDDWTINLRGPPSPCNVTFFNDNILIDGRSSLNKLPKQQKLKIQFNDSATSTFEYPSESSLMEDNLSSPAAAPSPIGNSLSNYTPSKVLLNSEIFQLGVTRTTHPLPLPPKSSSPSDYETDDFLKPANDLNNVTWGHETVSDLLF